MDGYMGTVMGTVVTAAALAAVTVLAVVVWRVLAAQQKTRDFETARRLVEDLVHAVEWEMLNGPGKEKLAAVLAQVKARYPWVDDRLVNIWVDAVLERWRREREIAQKQGELLAAATSASLSVQR